MKVLGNLDWRHPLVHARVFIAAQTKKALGAAGVWRALSLAETAVVQTDAVGVTGDQPPQRRLIYKTPRPEFVDVENLTYTSAGIAIHDGQYAARYSIRTPSILQILKKPESAVSKIIARGTVVECETPYTYGDWVGDYVLSLVTAQNLIEPLVLPAYLAKKPYVIRDVEALNIQYIVAEKPVCIETARVLRKRTPSYYWGPAEVDAYRKHFAITPPQAASGSITYLARFNTVSETAQRAYPSKEVAQIVTSLGGEVFDARQSSPEQFNAIGAKMETVIGDQGSALFGVMHWRTKNVIELTRRDWWHNANLFIANGSGVENYAVIAVDGLNEAALRARIEGHLRAFGVTF
ncbi:hypothetical protein [Hyphococcus sp.]|uniref:hypothetical protein n=1 Tax=Hyphococcus sp. TaxID=2038636 RepID=UPI00208CEB59|nr:MAG: hypothetical protein DHS20C04_22430 [Marinicaulis sp.]